MADTRRRLHPVNDVATILGVSTFTIRRCMNDGRIEKREISGRVMVPDEEVERILREGLPLRNRHSAEAR